MLTYCDVIDTRADRQQLWRHNDRLFRRGCYGRFLSTTHASDELCTCLVLNWPGSLVIWLAESRDYHLYIYKHGPAATDIATVTSQWPIVPTGIYGRMILRSARVEGIAITLSCLVHDFITLHIVVECFITTHWETKQFIHVLVNLFVYFTYHFRTPVFQHGASLGFWRSLNNTYPIFLTPCIRYTNHLCDSCDLTDRKSTFYPVITPNDSKCWPTMTSSIHEPAASNCDVTMTYCSCVVAMDAFLAQCCWGQWCKRVCKRHACFSTLWKKSVKPRNVWQVTPWLTGKG